VCLSFFALPLPVSESIHHTVDIPTIPYIYILIFIFPSHSSPPHKVCLYAKHHFSTPAPASEMASGVVCGGWTKHIVAPATRFPSGPWALHQSRPQANASTGIAARRVRRTGTTGLLLWRRPGLALSRPAQISSASTTASRLLPATPSPPAT